MLENKQFEGIHYSRFVSSWNNAVNGKRYYFVDWLRSLIINDKKIPEEIIREINEMRMCGKLELEMHAEQFIKNIKD